MKIPASKVPAQVWAEKAMRNRAGLREDERECLDKWLSSKQVYRVNEEIWTACRIDRDTVIPVQAFSQLPYGCVFIQHASEYSVPMGLQSVGRSGAMSERVEGYFVYRGMTEKGSEYLSIAPLGSTRTIVDGTEIGQYDGLDSSNMFHLGHGGTVGDWLGEVKSVSVADTALYGIEEIKRKRGTDSIDFNEATRVTAMLTGFYSEYSEKNLPLPNILGSLLYIVSKNADVRTVYTPQQSRPKRSRQTDCTVHDVGFRIAPGLSEVRRAADSVGRGNGGTGRHVSTHVRRGHWHGYWLGPKNAPTDLVIKWVAPVIVNGDGEVAGRIHDL